MTETAYLLLGSNMGDRMDHLRLGVEALRGDAGHVVAISSVYESEPWGCDHSQWFLNLAVKLDTQMNPPPLLSRLHRIEQSFGRVRSGEGYQPRNLDIDILLYGNKVFNTPELFIPHLRLTERMFALLPLAEIAPDLMHPVLNCTVEWLCQQCGDLRKVNVFAPSSQIS